MFNKTVCYYSQPLDVHTYVFTVKKGKNIIGQGVTHGTFNSLKITARLMTGKKIKDFRFLKT